MCIPKKIELYGLQIEAENLESGSTEWLSILPLTKLLIILIYLKWLEVLSQLSESRDIVSIDGDRKLAHL